MRERASGFAKLLATCSCVSSQSCIGYLESILAEGHEIGSSHLSLLACLPLSGARLSAAILCEIRECAYRSNDAELRELERVLNWCLRRILLRLSYQGLHCWGLGWW